MKGVVPLRPVEAALLEKFRETRSHLDEQRETIERELRKLDRRSGDDLMISAIDQVNPPV